MAVGLGIAEVELSLFTRQCLNRRTSDLENTPLSGNCLGAAAQCLTDWRFSDASVICNSPPRMRAPSSGDSIRNIRGK